MNIFIITQDEPFYLPVFFKRLIPYLKNEIVGMAILPEKKSKVSQIKKYMDFYGIKFFCFQLFWYFTYKISDLTSYVLPWKKLYSVRHIAQINRIPIVSSKDINSEEFINSLKKDKVDLIISVASPQIFRKELINTPPLGCINVHGAPLPKYRGMLPSFWMLANNEKEGAVTIHYINEKIDDGDIILQQKYAIDPNETLHSLILKSKKMGAELLLKAIDRIRSENVSTKPNNSREATYYSFPTCKDVQLFIKSGKRFR